MSHPGDDVLADLALGQPVDEVSSSHVDGCDECGRDLAALRRTLAAVAEGEGLHAPGPQVWNAIVAATSSEAPAAAPAPPGRSARRFSLGSLAVATTLGALVGVGAIAAVNQWRAPEAEVVASANLATLDTGATRGVAEVERVRGQLEVRIMVSSDPYPGGYLEVWLINRDLERMVSLGVLPQGTSNRSYPVPQSLLDEGYVIVDISREPLDDQPAHSGDSIVRGTLAI